MRKWFFGVLLLAILLVCVPACAETYVFDSIYGTVDVPDTYIILTQDNLADYESWLESRGTTSEILANDMLSRGVLLQAWTSEYDACFELTAVQTAETLSIFDVNEQSTSARASYRLSHYPDNAFLSLGYDFSQADWKNTDNGRFLVLRYIFRENGEIDHRGLMRRTIRNGYEVTFDMKVYGRALTNKDNTSLNNIWDTFKFVEIQPLPPAASAKINITTAPPAETNDASISLEGTAAEGVKLTTVVMGLSYPDPMLSEVEVGKSGKFKIPIKLPKEGVFNITVTGEYQGVEVIDALLYTVTYQRTLLTINVTSTVPEVTTSDTLTISGTASAGASIQVFVNDESVMTKRVNAAGKFTLDVDTSQEGTHTIVVAFSQKGLADRRLTYTVTRQWTDDDMLKWVKKQAIKPSYKNLCNKIDGYTGQIMGYKSYVVSIAESGSGWIVQMAMTKNSGNYTNLFLVTTTAEPTVAVDSRVMMYGTCTGMSVAGQEGGSAESYPCFDLLLFNSL